MRDQFRALLDTRTRHPKAIAEAAARPMAMADRADLLERMALALSRPDDVAGAVDTAASLMRGKE